MNAEVDLTVVALTLDADGRVTSAIGDMAEPALTIAADGGVTAPDTVRSKLELGDSYGMRNASSLGKEWYEHSEGYCSYLKGKTEKEVADIPADGSDADLAALCTISIELCKRPQGMRLRMRHYKLNGKSDRHREVAVFLRLSLMGSLTLSNLSVIRLRNATSPCRRALAYP